MTALNSVINYTALGIALWLGLYLVTHSRRRLAWLAAGTLWALAGYFLNRVVNLDFPEETGAALLGSASVTLAAPLWYHLSTQFHRPAPDRRFLVPLSYALMAGFILLLTRTELVFGGSGVKPNVLASDAGVGPLYPLYGAFLLIWPLLGLWNFHAARQASVPALRRQLTSIVRATLVGLAGAAYLVVASALRLSAPNIIGDLALGVAVALLGYAVARYNAILERHTASADFPYAAAWISLIVVGYLVLTWVSYRLYGIPPSAYVLLFVLVIISHTLSDWFRNQLDRLFYRRAAVRLRENLRALAREVGSGDALDVALSTALNAACHDLGTDRGLVALRRDGGLTVAASLNAGPTERNLVDVDLPEEAAGLVQPSPDLSGLAAVAPLVWAGELLGCIMVGERSGGYTSDDLVTLTDIADGMASVVYAARASETATAELNSQIEQFRAREYELQRQVQALTTPVADGLNEAALTHLVEDALRHLHDFAYLGEHRLARLAAVEATLAGGDGPITLLARGQAVRDTLLRTLQRLRPPGAEPRGDAAASQREWHSYLILYESYVEGIPNRDTMNRLYISHGTYNRTRRQALRGLARDLAEQGTKYDTKSQA
jgi:hypothetical protein